MNSVFSDCLSLLFIPDISNWNNYNENDLHEIPDYNRINDTLNFIFEYYVNLLNPERYDISNDNDYKQQLKDKMDKFL